MNVFFSIDSTILLALHGWGMDESAWDSMTPLLQNKIPFQAVSLPGYQKTPELSDITMDKVVDWLAEQFEGKCHLLGWSMGGLVAQAFAYKYPERVASLSMVASTPCFTQKADWSDALAPEVLDKFSENLLEKRDLTLKRFIALQFMGELAATGIQKRLRQLAPKQSTSLATLAIGLTWLKECDYRQQLASLTMPQHWMFGELDQLIPVSIGQALQDEFPDIMISYFNGCGHAPHISQTERFTETLLDFISQHTSKDL